MDINRLKCVLLCGFLTLVSASRIDAAPACASMATGGMGNWAASIFSFTISQSGSGSVKTLTGTGTSTSAYFRTNFVNPCPAGTQYNLNSFSSTYTISGSAAGQVTINAALVGNNSLCYPTFTMAGSLAQPGCDSLNNATINVGQGNAPISFTHACYVPSSETPSVLLNWGAGVGYTDVAVFQTSLQSTSFDWGGRTIAETFPQGGTDSCYFSGSIYTPMQPVAAAPSVLNSGTPSSYQDQIGMADQAAAYYRATGHSPCGLSATQVMVIACDSGNMPYMTNALFLGPDKTNTISQRGNVRVTTPWGIPYQAPSTYQTIVNWFFNLGH